MEGFSFLQDKVDVVVNQSTPEEIIKKLNKRIKGVDKK